MFAGIQPDEVNKALLKENGYVRGCLTVDSTSAKILGLKYNGRVYKNPGVTCIAETDHYKKKGVPQHFFVLLPDGRRVDPLDLNPKPEKNDYRIKSYRLIESLSDSTDDSEEPIDNCQELLELKSKMLDAAEKSLLLATEKIDEQGKIITKTMERYQKCKERVDVEIEKMTWKQLFDLISTFINIKLK
jgi:hypothetical protein